MSKPTIMSIGAAVQDVFLSHSDEFIPVAGKDKKELFLQLELGSKEDVNKINFSTGGGATNAAVTFARQGLHAIFNGTIGHDPAGESVLRDLDREGVDTQHVSYSNKYNTGYSVLLLAPNGERTILTYRGASTHYNVKHFDLNDVDGDLDWLYISSMAGSVEVLDKILHQARAKGVKVCMNPGKGELAQPRKLKSLLEDIDVLLVNKDEAAQMVEGETSEELVRHLSRYVPTAIISDGPNGVVATDRKTIVNAGMYKDVPVVDRTGAGDAFGSGFLSQWCQGVSLKDSIIFASANSTSVVQTIGAKYGILSPPNKLDDMPLTEKDY